MEPLVLDPGHRLYPRRLKDRMGPEAPVLYAQGPLEHLSRWTLAFLTADHEPGLITRTVWGMFAEVLPYEMNAIGGWQSVSEGVFFRTALENPWVSLTLFTSRGIQRETCDSFLADRHRPPQDSFVQRDEYERRAAADELLLLSVSPPDQRRQTREMIMKRNWVACHLADAVFIGGAERVSMQWSHKKRQMIGRRQKTFALARRLVKTAIPLFTVEHEENGDLMGLGVPGLRPDNVHGFLEGLGARKGKAPAERPAESVPQPIPPSPPRPRPTLIQLPLFKERRRKSGRAIRRRPKDA